MTKMQKQSNSSNVQNLIKQCFKTLASVNQSHRSSFQSFDPYQVFEVQHEHCHVLTVTVLKGTNISKGYISDLLDTPDPFVILRVPGTPNGKKRTKCIGNNVNPVWDEEFTFFIDPSKESVLEVTLMEANVLKDSKLGVQTLSINQITLDKKVHQELHFTNKSTVYLEIYCEVDKTPDLRYSLALCDEEKEFLASRRTKVLEGMRNLLGEDGPQEESEVPVIAVLGSGGGFRALTAFSGVYKALKDSGVLDCVTYIAGLSGSAWFLSTLYSHPKFPDLTPEELQNELKENVSKDWRKLLLSDSVPYLRALINKYKGGQPVSFTDMFGHLLGDVLIPDRKASSRLSDQQRVVSSGNVPLPLYTCLHVKGNVSARVYQEWFEFSPYEIGISKYGTFMKSELFGSKFIMGRLLKKYSESPLHFLQGVWGSAFTILLKRYIQEKGNTKSAEMKTATNLSDLEEQQMLFGELDIFEENPGSKFKSSNLNNSDPFSETFLDLEKPSDSETDDDESSDVDSIRSRDENDDHAALNGSGSIQTIQSQNIPRFEFPTVEKEVESGNEVRVINGGILNGAHKFVSPFSRKKQTSRTLERKDAIKRKSPTISRESSRSSGASASDLDEETHLRIEHAANTLNADSLRHRTKFEERKPSIESSISNTLPSRPSLPNLSAGFKKSSCPQRKYQSASAASNHAGGIEFWKKRRTIRKNEREEKATSFFGGMVDRILQSETLDTRAIRAGRIYNPFRGLSLKQTQPVSPFTQAVEDNQEETEFSRFREAISTESKKIYVVDSGLTFNIPFPLVLRPQRGVDIFLSFDFSGRQADDHTPFETLKVAEKWAKAHRIPFPPISELTAAYEKQPIRECYIFKDKNDAECPVILHFIIVNQQFKQYSAPGIRRTEEEMEEANFSIFTDPNNPYSLFNFQYTEQQYKRLADLMEFNTRLYVHEIKKFIKDMIELRRSVRSPGYSPIQLQPAPSKKRLSRLRSVMRGQYAETTLNKAKLEEEFGRAEVFLDALEDLDET